MLTGAQPDANGVLVLLPPVLSPAAIRISPRHRRRKEPRIRSARRLAGASTCLSIYPPRSPRDPASETAKNGPLAAHRRLVYLWGERLPMWYSEPIRSASTNPMSGQEESDGIDVEGIRETDRNRRQTTMTSTGAIEANQLRTGTLTSFWRDFISQKRPTSEGRARHLGTMDHLVSLYREAGNTSIATSEASPPARTRTDPVSSNSAPAQGVPARKGRILGHVAATRHSTVNSTLSNSTQNLKSW